MTLHVIGSARKTARASGAALLAAALLATAAPGGAEARPPAATSGEVAGIPADFTRALARVGEWVALRDGGRAWRPDRVAADWRPYRDGHWTATTDGWFWVSAEPWAWATYHYGRWRFDPSLGWVWIPGGRWVPASVVWRMGAGVVGWAPATDDGFLLPAHWTFLPASGFVEVDASRGAVPAPRVPALLVRTRAIAGGGPPRAAVERPRAAARQAKAPQPPSFATAN